MTALLASECVFWLFVPRGFPGLDWYRGAILAGALTNAVCVLLLLPVCWLLARLFRFPFQYHTRTILLLVVVVAVPCSWLAVEIKQAREERIALEAIRTIVNPRGITEDLQNDAVSFYEEYDWQLDGQGDSLPGARAPEPGWLRALLGQDVFSRVAGLSVFHSNFGDSSMEHIARFGSLQKLNLVTSGVTDTGLARLKGLTGLRALFLTCTKVTDAGLENVEGMAKLRVLDLSSTEVTDAGLKHLKDLTQLQVLSLAETKIRGTGLINLNRLTRLQRLNLRDTEIHGDGLENVRRLQQALPNCKIQL